MLVNGARPGLADREAQTSLPTFAHESKTVGIVLCSEKNDAMVRITLPEDNDQILAATYKRYLPTEAQLRSEFTREREEAERLLRLGSSV